MDQQFLELYDRHVGTAFDKQRRFADDLARKAPGEKPVLDAENAVLAYGPKLKFEAHLLGEHHASAGSWVWAWTDKHRKLAFTNRALGEALRAVAHRLGLHYLTHPGFSLEPLLGPDLVEKAAHMLGVVLGAELGYDAYLIAPIAGGTSLVLIRDERLKVVEKHPLRRVLAIFPQAVAAMPAFNARAALRAYADDYGLAVSEDAGGLKLVTGTDHLTAAFDVHDRLLALEGTVQPEAPPKPPAKKKPKPKPKPAPKTPAAKKPPVKVKRVVKAAAKVKKKPIPKKPAPKKPAKAAKKASTRK